MLAWRFDFLNLASNWHQLIYGLLIQSNFCHSMCCTKNLGELSSIKLTWTGVRHRFLFGEPEQNGRLIEDEDLLRITRLVFFYRKINSPLLDIILKAYTDSPQQFSDWITSHGVWHHLWRPIIIAWLCLGDFSSIAVFWNDVYD